MSQEFSEELTLGPAYDSDERLLAVKDTPMNGARFSQTFASSQEKSSGSGAPLRNGSLVSLGAFWFMTLIGLSVPYRRWLERRCGVATLAFVKEVSFAPPPSYSELELERSVQSDGAG